VRKGRDALRGTSLSFWLLARQELSGRVGIASVRRMMGGGHFSARGATKVTVEATAWEDYEGAGEEQYP
jgi:hypothetical protein